MSIIPSFYRSDYENYITVPAMLLFLKDVGIKNVRSIREECLEAIEEFGLKSSENKKRVYDWLDSLLRQGTIELHLHAVEFDELDRQKLEDIEWVKTLNTKLEGNSLNFCEQGPSSDFRIINISEVALQGERVISFSLYRTVHVYPKDKKAYTLNFPVFVDIFIEKSMVIIRGKSKSTMYEYTDGSFDLDINQQLVLDSIFQSAYKKVCAYAGLGMKIKHNHFQLKQKLYQLLEKYTETPKEISAMMEEKRQEIQNVAKTISESICNLPSKYEQDIIWDVNNLVEKYFSINYPDKKVFTKDRDAYPLKLIATDDEESRVEQTSGLEEPLQSKAVFFDNKKMMQKTKSCEGISFVYNRENALYLRKKFKVTFTAKSAYFAVKFIEFTMEEDINRVLFSLLDFE